MKRSAEYFRRVSRDYGRYSRWTNSPTLVTAEFDALARYASEGSTVLDVGAGTADYLQRIATSKIYVGASLLALDASAAMLLGRHTRGNDYITRVLGDFHKLPIADGGVDRVIARQVLHYVDLLAALYEVRRVLSCGGIFHSTQQVDYDEVPEEWYLRWSGLRGAPSRQRLSDPALTDAAARVGLNEVHRTYCPVGLHYTWSELAYKYGTPGAENGIRDFFTNSPEAVRARFDFQLTIEGISYTSRFRVSAFDVLA